jgi:hypothetical protein
VTQPAVFEHGEPRPDLLPILVVDAAGNPATCRFVVWDSAAGPGEAQQPHVRPEAGRRHIDAGRDQVVAKQRQNMEAIGLACHPWPSTLSP